MTPPKKETTAGTITQLARWLSPSGPSTTDVPRSPDAWLALADAAAQEGLAGLLLEHSRKHGIEVPTVAADRLRDASMAVAANNVRLNGQLENIVQAFNRAGVPVMLLKGAALNPVLYQRLDLRPMSDLDLLIDPAAVEKVLRLLGECGCRRGFDLVREDFFPKYHYELELLTRSQSPARIDLHARPFRPLRVSRTMPDAAMWQDAQKIQLQTAEAMIPRPALMLLHLAVHAAYHGCTRLLWLYDIKRFADYHHDQLDWSVLTRCARQWRLSWPVLRAFERAADLFGPACPSAVIKELASHHTSWRDRLTLAQAPRDASSPVSHILVNLLCTPGVRFRLGYARAVLFPHSLHLADIYPFRHRGWVPVAHAWRLLRLLKRGAGSL